MEVISELSEDGKPVNIWPTLNHCTIDIINDAVIGRHCDTQRKGYSDYSIAINR